MTAALGAFAVIPGSWLTRAQSVEDGAVMGAASLPRDLSPLGMYLNADLVVKAVLLCLVFASVITWTVWLAKTIEILRAKRRVRADLATLGTVRSAPEAAEAFSTAKGEVSEFVDAAALELRMSSDLLDRDGIKERVASRLERIEAARNRRMLRGTSVLATIGATAPFIGLFGTVWGIMNSFIGISKSHTQATCRAANCSRPARPRPGSL